MNKLIPWNLIIAGLKNDLNEDELSRLERWKVSDQNRKRYEEFSKIWFGIQDLSATYTPDKDYYWQILHTRMQKEKKQATLTSKKKSFNVSRYVAAACIVLTLLTAGGAYWIISDLKSRIRQEVRFSNLSGRSQVLLADGTQVWLHSNTSLDYKQSLRSEEREVTMMGEAYFNVAHDAEHPFVVHMDGMKLTVYGTKFNIRDLPESKEVQVSLQEGAVGLETSRENCRMLPGEKATFNKITHTLQIERSDVNFDISWAQKQIVFNQKPLGFICRYLSKWYNVEIKLEPDLMNKYLYTFTLSDESLEEIMRLVARVNPIHYYFNEENKLFISSKK